MQLLLIRHGRPHVDRQADPTAGRPADPELTDTGHAQAGRVIDGCAPYRIAAIRSSPLARARQTAEPLARALGLTVRIDEDLAEYDRDRAAYVPIDAPGARGTGEYERIRAGLLPAFVDEAAFSARVDRVLGGIIAGHGHPDTVAVFCHGGVINVFLQRLLRLDRPLVFPIEYASITRVLVSRDGTRRAASVNETGHVRELLRQGPPPHSTAPAG